MVLDFRRKDEQQAPWYTKIGLRAFSYAFLFLAVVVSLIARELRRPQPFSWLIEGGLYTNPVVEPIDTRVVPEPKRAKPVHTIDEDVVQIEPVEESPDSPEPQADFFPGIKPGQMDSIQDGSPHRSAEREAYYNFMKVLNEHDADTFRQYLEQNGKGAPVAFAQIFRQPKHYRGRLIRVKCKAHSCIENKFGKNSFGLEKYYHLYLESSEGQLMQANVLEIPAGFPMSTVDKDRNYSRFDEEIELVGFFYKLVPYSARDDVRNSPLMFAKTVQWARPVAPPSEALTWTTLAMLLIGGMIVGITAAFFLSRQTALKTHKRKHGPPTAAEIAALGKLGESHRTAEGQQPASPAAAPENAASANTTPTNTAPSANGAAIHHPQSSAFGPSNGPEATRG